MREEKNFPDWVKPHLTSKEIEDNYRSLFCKADALEHIKTERDDYRGRLGALEQAAQNAPDQFLKATGMQEVLQRAAQEDPLSFLELSGLPKEALLHLASRILEMEELPPHQRQVIEENRTLRRKVQDTESRYSRLEPEANDIRKELHEDRMERALSVPEIAEFAKAYDERRGKPGAFRRRADLLGNQLFLETKKYVLPSEVVRMCFEEEKQIFGPLSSPGTQSTTTNHGAPPVIPSPGTGNRTSPVKGSPKSLDDLRKMHKERTANEG